MNLGWLTVKERRDYLTLVIVYKSLNSLAPNYQSDLFTYVSDVHERTTRQSQNSDLYLSNVRTSYVKKSLQYHGASLWNQLPVNIRNSNNLQIFKVQCKNE